MEWGCEVSDAGEALNAVESLTAVCMFMSHYVLSLSKEMRDSAVVLSAWWELLTQTCLLPLEARDSHLEADEGGGLKSLSLPCTHQALGNPTLLSGKSGAETALY